MTAAPLLLHAFATFGIGGPQTRFCGFANHFGARLRHAIVAMDGDLAAAGRLRPDVPVIFPEGGLQKGDTFGNVRRCLAVLRRLRPDLLVTYNWGSIEWTLANVLAGRPQVHFEDGFGPDERCHQLRRRVLARRLLLRRVPVVLPSRTLLRIAGEVWRLPPARLCYIPNGIDLARFTGGPGEVGSRRGDLPVVGTVATLRAEKNLGRLLHAFARLNARRPARLAIVGEGPERPALAALAAQLGIADAVDFAGFAGSPEIAYRQFDVFALSSDTEQMPMSVLEAMAAGLPVAATDVGDVAAMLADVNRPFVVGRDADALAAAMWRLLSDAPLRVAIGAANRIRAESEFDERRMFQAYANLFGVPSP